MFDSPGQTGHWEPLCSADELCGEYVQFYLSNNSFIFYKISSAGPRPDISFQVGEGVGQEVDDSPPDGGRHSG